MLFNSQMAGSPGSCAGAGSAPLVSTPSLRVAVKPVAPFVMQDSNPRSGFSIDLWRLIASPRPTPTTDPGQEDLVALVVPGSLWDVVLVDEDLIDVPLFNSRRSHPPRSSSTHLPKHESPSNRSLRRFLAPQHHHDARPQNEVWRQSLWQLTALCPLAGC